MTAVKICGITNPADALSALNAGADMLGINFYSCSPRCIGLDKAQEIIAALPVPSSIIGVFVDPRRDDVLQAVACLGLAAVQLHGEEDDELISTLLKRTPVIKAVRTQLEAGRAAALGCRVLLDSPSPQFGGSGELADWSLARRISRCTPEFYLAGGLTSLNVGAAIRFVCPQVVDVCSGVELSPGRKSKEAMNRFVRATRMEEIHVEGPA